MRFSDHELDEKVLFIARRLSRSAEFDTELRGWFLYGDLRAEVEACLGVTIPLNRHSGPVRRLMQSGRIVMRPGRIQNSKAFRATGLEEVHLGLLMAAAREYIDPDLRGSRGRRGERTVDRISPRQYTRMRTMARSVAFHLHPTLEEEDEAFAAVRDPDLFAWDPAAGPKSAGDWRPFLELVEKSSPRTRLRADISAARKLLDLAASQGLIARAGVFRDRGVIPARWAEVEGRWRDALDGVIGRTTISYGMTRLIPVMADVLPRGADPGSLALADAQRVIRRLEAMLSADSSLEPWQRWHVRQTYRALMDLELFPRVDTNAHGEGKGLSAWGRGFCRAVGEAADAAPGCHEVWSEFPFPKLGDPANPYGLPAVVEYFTLKGIARSKAGYRGLALFPGVQPRRTSLASYQYWSGRTVESKLDHLSTFFGYLERYTNLDLQEIDLREAFTETNLEGFVDAVNQDAITTRGTACRVLHTIGLISSPHLEIQARANGASGMAEQFMGVSALACGNGRAEKLEEGSYAFEGSSLMHQIKEERQAESVFETARREAHLLQSVFEDQMGVHYAYDGMISLYEAAKTRVLRALGVGSIGELLEGEGPREFSRRTLCDLRALAYWNDALNVPLRQRTVAEQKLEHRRPRRGGLLLHVPKRLMKIPHDDYRVMLTPGTDGAGYDSDMWRLYAMPNGVRDQLLDGTPCERVYVNDMRAGNVKGPHLKHGSVSRMMKRVLTLGALELGLDPAGFKPVGKNKFFRHAVASYLVPRNKIYQAVTLLHHTSDKMIRRVYAHDGDTTTMAEVRAEAGQTAGSSGPLGALVKQFGDETLLAVLRAAGFIGAGEPPDQRQDVT